MRIIISRFVKLCQIIKAELILLFFGQMALNNYIRKLTSPTFLLKYLGVKIGEDSLIYPGITINCADRKKYKYLKIGNHVRILWDVIIDLNDDVIIEDYVHIGAQSCIITHFHLGKTPLGKTEYPYVRGKVKICKGTAVGWKCIVLRDTKIGEHSIISVGSIVKGQIPSFCVFAGNPGRPIKKIKPKNVKDFE